MGSRQNVALACLTLAMFHALPDEDFEYDYAVELVGDACWKVYAQWGQLPRLMARFASLGPVERMRHQRVDLFRRFPFNLPGYRYEPEGQSLDMLGCPAAEYRTSHGAAGLTVGSCCNLDFQLARTWGGTLERKGSLAGGAPLCDFRFKATTRPDRARQVAP
jgi:ubiquinone biosynthesis protein